MAVTTLDGSLESKELFQAELPESMKPGICKKILNIVYLIISILIPVIGLIRIAGWILRSVLSFGIVPASIAHESPVLTNQVVKESGGEIFKIKTPDGDEIETLFVKGSEHPKKVILHFTGNGGNIQNFYQNNL